VPEDLIVTAIPIDHHILLATQKQREALIAERNALREQVAAIATERDALGATVMRLIEELKTLRAELEHARSGQMALLVGAA
jgi:uncharacterized coiled-coil DUF342 family protein